MSKIKRLSIVGEVYFITVNTHGKLWYFVDNGMSKVLLENIRFARQTMNFDLYAFIIMPNHLHLAICPKGEKNISQIMHFIKRHTSRQINDKLKGNDNTLVAEVGQPRLPGTQLGLLEHINLLNNITVENNCEVLFKWQSSFYDRRIRNEFEFQATLDYINSKNLSDLIYKYKICTEENAKDYPLYSFTNPDLIDPY